MRVYGALMWSLGKVLATPEVARVYIGSVWNEPLRYDINRRLFEAEDDKSSNKRVVIVVDLEQYFGQKFALDEIRDEPFTKEKVDQNTKLLDNELGNQNSKMVCTYSIEHLNMGTSKGERNNLLLDRDDQQYWPK